MTGNDFDSDPKFRLWQTYDDDPVQDAMDTAEALRDAGKKPIDESPLVTACYQELVEGVSA